MVGAIGQFTLQPMASTNHKFPWYTSQGIRKEAKGYKMKARFCTNTHVYTLKCSNPNELNASNNYLDPHLH